MSELTALLTPEGLRLLDELPAVDSADEVARVVSRLRKDGHSPELVSAVVTQARLRVKRTDEVRHVRRPHAVHPRRARAGHAACDRRASRRTVPQMPDWRGSPTSAAGSAATRSALAAAGPARPAVDADDVTAAIAAYNLAPFGDQVSVTCTDRGGADLSEVDAVWLDPGSAHRRAHRDLAHSPRGLVAVTGLGVRALRRACRPASSSVPGSTATLIPDDVEAQWVSADGVDARTRALVRRPRPQRGAPRGAGHPRRRRRTS